MLRLALSLPLLFLLASCATFDEGEGKVVSLREVILEDIEELLGEGSFLAALQDIDFLMRQGKVDAGDLSRLREKGLSQVAGELITHFENKDYYRAYGLYLSLQAASREDLAAGFSVKKILAAWAEGFQEEGRNLLALSVYQRMLSEDYLDTEELEELLVFAHSAGNTSATRAVVEKMDALKIAVGEKYRDALLRSIPPSEMMKGTSTIWVDKGIKIEDGIGYPDRVMGSGFFVENEGYILTNYHVIASEVDPEYEGYSRLYVRLPGHADEKIPAKVVGWDRIFDLALLKVEVEPEFVFRAIGDISAVPGEKVFVIGSPVDPFLENTITSGIISAVGRRRLLQMGDVLQVDAPVNPGNSGGPLINERGELIGVVFAGYQFFKGLNFAIPVHWVSKMLPRLFAGDDVTHPWLGAAVVENRDQLEIIYIVPGESAEKGGLLPGDIIISVNGRHFVSIKDLQSYILDLPHDTLARVEWSRSDQKQIGLFSFKQRPYSPIELALERDTKLNVLVPLFGMQVKEVGGFLWEKNYVVERVIKGSAADNASISPNDPLNLQGWRVDEERRLVILRVFVKKKKAGFLESILQLIAYMEPDSFL